LNTNQFRLTEKGGHAWEDWELEGGERWQEERSLIDLPEHLQGLVTNIGWNFNKPIKTPQEVRGIKLLLRWGWIEEDTSTVDELLFELGGDPLGRAVETYVKIAREEPTSEEEIEECRKVILDEVETSIGQFGDEKLLESIVEDLSEAETRSEKIIAIDRGIGWIHGSVGPHPSRYHPMTIVSKILDRLAEGEEGPSTPRFGR